MRKLTLRLNFLMFLSQNSNPGLSLLSCPAGPVAGSLWICGQAEVAGCTYSF